MAPSRQESRIERTTLRTLSAPPLTPPSGLLNATETRIQVPGVRSLVWEGDTLVDWVAGGRRYLLDGTVTERAVSYAYPFDSAVSLPGSAYAAIYASRETKALILRNGEIHREVNDLARVSRIP